MASTSFLARGVVHEKNKTNMAARGFFRARLLLSSFKRNLRISETAYIRTTLVNFLYSRQIVSGVQCSSFKGKTAIDRDGDCERKDSQNGHTNGEPTYHYKLSRLIMIVLATFYGLYFVCSTGTMYAGERDGDKGCFASKRRIQFVKKIATDKNDRTQDKENQLE